MNFDTGESRRKRFQENGVVSFYKITPDYEEILLREGTYQVHDTCISITDPENGTNLISLQEGDSSFTYEYALYMN